MTFRSRMGLRSRRVVACAAALLASVFSVACGGPGSTSDAQGVDLETKQLELTAGSGRTGGHGAAEGTLGHHCSPTGAHACAARDRMEQLVCGASGVWQANGTCSAGSECDATPGAAAGTCKPMVPKCSHEDDSDDVARHGRGREWNGRPPPICDFERCVDERHHERWQRVCMGACTPGAAQCSGNGVQTCDASGQWGTAVPCQYVCDAATGACTGVCTPGVAQCSGNGVQTCDASGQWGTAVGCVNQACDVATGACTGVCTPGAAQCSGNGVQTCDVSGQWGTAVECVNQACDGAAGACTGVCSPGATQCSGNGVQTCDASGQWGAAIACVNQACDGATGTCTGVCTPGVAQCSGNGVQTCDASGQWGTAVACVNQACDAAAGACTGVCTPGAAQCSGNGVQTCDASGQWGTAVACVNQACDGAAGACTGMCSPGATQCSGNGVQTCDASGQWGTAVACVNQACDGAAGACTGMCSPGATQCSGNGVQTCDASGQWGTAVACVNQACDGAAGACTGMCSPGATQCSGNGVQTCDASGQWGTAVACQYACDVVLRTCSAGACAALGPMKVYTLQLQGTFASQSLDRTTCVVSSSTLTSARATIQLSQDGTQAVFTFQYGNGVAYLGQIGTVVATASGFQVSGNGVCSFSSANNQGTFSVTFDSATGLATVTGSCGPPWPPLSCAAPRTLVAGTFSGTGQWCDVGSAG